MTLTQQICVFQSRKDALLVVKLLVDLSLLIVLPLFDIDIGFEALG